MWWFKGSGGLMDKLFVSQPGDGRFQSLDRGFEPYTGHDYDSSLDTSTGWYQEADSKVNKL